MPISKLSIKQGIISLERMMETVCIKDAETTYRSSGYRKMLLRFTGKGGHTRPGHGNDLIAL